MQIKDLLRAVYGIIAGTLLYIPLMLVPFAGPLYAGIFAGKKARTMPLTGFLVGIASAALGYLFWTHEVFPLFNIRTADYVSGIFRVLFLGWNIFCALLAGIGGMMGSILAYSEKMLSGYNGARRENKQTEDIRPPETSPPTFIICPSCGTSNQEDSTHCKNCGRDIR
jgi:hypothetical protein